ncbi:MAG: YqgE/AlgH family protein [Bacteroides sp.]|nr:YqgE/AlgH family protein [Bacteroides sp.]MBD5307185.1 YqgE/AlgH family protein [Bacteroides sp.]
MEDIDIEKYIYGGQGMSAPGKGRLLIAQPLMTDPNFSRSAILLLEGNKKSGYIGLVLNHRSRLTMADIIKGCPEDARFPVYVGGPVEQERLFMIHTLGDQIKDAVEIANGIYCGGDLEEISEYIRSNEGDPTKIRFFLGYSGWSAGQLESEIMQRSWGVQQLPQSSDLLSGAGNEYWRREVSRLGKEYRNWLAVPQIPDLN